MSEFIPVSEAVKMNAAYRANRESILKPEYQGRNILCICETFDKVQVDTLLNKTGCEKMRVYYGMDDTMKVHAVLCAVDGSGTDILPPQSAKTKSKAALTDADYTLEIGQRCPEECPPDSPLNTGG